MSTWHPGVKEGGRSNGLPKKKERQERRWGWVGDRNPRMQQVSFLPGLTLPSTPSSMAPSHLLPSL
jgi:hypothetical protein